MVILQALLAWLSKSVGKFFQAAFGWAVVALFGPRPKSEKTVLSAAVAAAAAWPVLVLGIPFPRIATFVLAFVPLSSAVDGWILRAVWAALALAVPIGIGLLLGKHAAESGAEGVWRKAAQGFPATLGVAFAFLFVALAAPVRKLVALARRRVALHVPVVVKLEAYAELAGVVEDVLRRARLGLSRKPAPFWEEAPVRLLRAIGGPIFRRQLPARLASFGGGAFSVLVSPNGLALEGPEFVVTRARGLFAEALTFSLALQTLDPEAQKLEKRLKSIGARDGACGARRAGARAADSLESVAASLLAADVPEDDFQVLHRELLQAACARVGLPPLLMASVADPSSGAGRAVPRPRLAEPASASKPGL